MRVIYSLIFLTLVLSPQTGLSAPNTTTSLESTSYQSESDPLLAGIEPKTHRNYLLSASVGFSGGNFLERDQYQQGPYLAVRYMPIVDRTITWDYQAEVTVDNLVGLSVGRRWYCCEDEAYNPYLRLSANMILHGSSELAGAIAIRRWRARAAAGVGDKFTSEFGLGMSVTGPDLFAQFGYNF